MTAFQQITIVGTGLLGGSIGLGLKAANVPARIIGVGRRTESVERARELGCVDQATTDLAKATADSQLVILATPLSAFPDRLEELARCTQPESIITDVGSAKQQVCDFASQCLPNPGRFVGSHPMAGSEHHGPQHARADLFTHRPCVITPTPETDPQAIDMVETLWTILGMHVMSMSPLEHDRKVAHVSHLPHAAAVLLVGLAARTNSLDIASSGFIDTTRVASGDPRVWLDIFQTNRQAVIEGIEQMIDEMKSLHNILQHGRRDELLEMLETTKAVRDRLVDAQQHEQARGNT